MKAKLMLTLIAAVFMVAGALALSPTAFALPGDLLATVDLDMPIGTAVGGTFDGTHYISVRAGGTTLYWMTPPPGNGLAALAFSKSIVDAADGVTPVHISAISWDPNRGMLWGAYGHDIWLIDVSGANAVATFQFDDSAINHDPMHVFLTDGLAYDGGDDTLYFSPDVDCEVYQFSLGTDGNPAGTLLNTVIPENDVGNADCGVSGVAIGADNTLYIGRNGHAEIRRVDKTSGAFVATFTTGTFERVEDLVCDPVTYAPLEAILAKDAYNVLYEAYEVETGTCPLPVVIDIKPGSDPNSINLGSSGVIPVAIFSSAAFDATTICPETIELAGAEVKVVGKSDKYLCHQEDVNNDGLMDLVCQVYTESLNVTVGDTVATLEAETCSGSAIVGQDSIRIVPDL